MAISSGSTLLVDLLIHRGVRIETTIHAAGAGQLELFQSKMDSELLEYEQLLEIFRIAVICDRIEIVDHLLQSGMIELSTMIDEASPLHWAAYYHKTSMLSHLIKIGSNPNLRDRKWDATPKGWAYRKSGISGQTQNSSQSIQILEQAEAGIRLPSQK